MRKYWESLLKNGLPNKTLSHFISKSPEIKRRTNSYKEELIYELRKYVKDDMTDDEIKQLHAMFEIGEMNNEHNRKMRSYFEEDVGNSE